MVSQSDLAFLTLTLAVCEMKKRKKKRERRWSKEWYKLRKRFTHERLLSFLRVTEPEDYKNYLRMNEAAFNNLLELIRPKIEKQDTVMRQAISASQRLSITLRYLASGMDLEDLKFTCAIAPQTLEAIIMETCESITQALKGNIQVPKTFEGWKEVANDFEEHWNFPNCLGSVDGKHILMEKPYNSGSYYYNYKGTFSIVLMAIVNAQYQFMMIDVGANGRVSDGGVMKNTVFWKKLSENQLNIPDPTTLSGTEKLFPFVLVGDEAFQLHPNFMKPYSRAHLTDEKRIFNYRLSRARRVVENAFGILIKRFKIFQKHIKFQPEKARKIVMCCCHLHNYLSNRSSDCYIKRGDVDYEDVANGITEEGSWRKEVQPTLPLQRIGRGNLSVEAKNTRDDFTEYFNSSAGSVSWQNKYLH